ncbi:MAG TPA: hypothetical protein VK970_03795, partial [Candidatus Methylacidiphilales bacterium]|nr:hypothetical protein [Candidatus Methylacidiphilales bacterium]
ATAKTETIEITAISSIRVKPFLPGAWTGIRNRFDNGVMENPKGLGVLLRSDTLANMKIVVNSMTESIGFNVGTAI